ncbi:LysR family transcriptional regulator [Paracoccus lutimaris]|uniref:LysR family transcriptional regulator n=1 Tax=Paracoccus lutimaris TaxID=1490030 RepID=UPI0011C083CB|nr:LysR substrate-binding domain-containing protein [Paracoccus lutimaris]
MKNPLPPEHILRRLLQKGRLRQFQMVLAVADLGNSHDAARTLAVSQPAITKAVQELEEVLGLAVFERHARGMRPTPMGREIVLFLRRIVATTGQFAETVATHHSTESLVVRIGAVAAGLNGVLAHHLPIFAEAHPQIRIRVDEIDGRQINTILADGEFDVIICRRQPTLPRPWDFTPLFWDEHAIIAAPDHPLVGRRGLRLDDLEGCIWMTPTTGVLALGLFEDLVVRCRNPGFCQIATRAPVIIRETLRQRRALAIVPLSTFQAELAAGTVARLDFPLNSPNAPVGLIACHEAMGAAALALVEYLRGHAAPEPAPQSP